MANLVVLKFDTLDGAEKGLELAVSLQKEQLLQIIDAATVSWPVGEATRTFGGRWRYFASVISTIVSPSARSWSALGNVCVNTRLRLAFVVFPQVTQTICGGVPCR